MTDKQQSSENMLAVWTGENARPDGIDLDIIEEMHPDAEGHIAFLRKNQEGQPRNVGSAKVSELREWFPEFIEEMTNDSYMSLNTMEAPRQVWRDSKKYGGYWGMQLRGKDMLSRFCSCYADIDCYTVGLTFDEAYSHIAALVADKTLPRPSIIGRSGRGMYLLWLLEPTRPTDDNKALHYETNRRIINTTEHLGSDTRAKDAARVFRVPGSYHTTTGPNRNERRRVQYILSLTSDGQPIRYSLPELSAMVPPALDSRERRKPTRSRRPKLAQPNKSVNVIRGKPLKSGSLKPKDLPPFEDAPQKRAARGRVDDLVRLFEGRGGIVLGLRTNSLRAYAQSLTAAYGIYGRELWEQVDRMNREACENPPHDKANTYDICSNVHAYYMTDKGKPRQIRTDTIVDALHIDTEEAKRLSLQVLVPTSERTRRRKAKQRKTRTRKKARGERLKYLENMTKTGGRKPTTRDIGVRFGVSHTQIARDLKSLGYKLTKTGHAVKVTPKTP